jgi:hypothetical protein
MWQLDERVTVTPQGASHRSRPAWRRRARGYIPTPRGRRAVRGLLAARDSILAEPTDRHGYTAEQREALDAWYAEQTAVCSTCDGRGFVYIREAGNSEMVSTCPECCPSYE